MGGGMFIQKAATQPEHNHTTQEIQDIQRNTNHTGNEEALRRIAYYCHFCCYHTYDVTRNADQHNVRFCSTRACLSGQRVPMEVIYLTPNGNQRLRQIIAQLRENSAGASSASVTPTVPNAVIPPFPEREPLQRPFRSSSIIHGLKLADLVLQVEIVDLVAEHQGQLCSICNEEFIGHTCLQSKENGVNAFVYHVDGCSCSISEREYDADTGRSSVLRLPCGHSYHQSCILPWLTTHSTCPYCRTPIIPIMNVPTVEELTAQFDEEQLTRKIVFAMVQDAKNDEYAGMMKKAVSRRNMDLNASIPPPPHVAYRNHHDTTKEDDYRYAHHVTKHTAHLASHKTSLTTMRGDLAQMLYHSLFRLLAKDALIPTSR